MDPTCHMYSHVPRFCDLRRCSRLRERYLLKTWLRDFQWLRGRGSWWLSDMWTEWVSRCHARESWASSEPFFPVRFEIRGSLKERMLHFRPVAVLPVSLWIRRWVTVSAHVNFAYGQNAGLSYFAMLSYDRSSILNDNCFTPELRFFAGVDKWAWRTGLHGRKDWRADGELRKEVTLSVSQFFKRKKNLCESLETTAHCSRSGIYIGDTFCQ